MYFLFEMRILLPSTSIKQQNTFKNLQSRKFKGYVMEKVIIDFLGYIAATITTIAFLPQIIKTVQTKSAKDVSMGMFVLFTTGVFLWIVYGILTRTYPVLIANAVIFCLALTQIILKIKYDKAEKGNNK